MRILGLWTEDNRRRYEKALALSVAAVDCESITVKTGGLGASDQFIKVAGISNERHDTSTRLSQKVIMVGHFDGNSKRDRARIFTVTKETGLDELARDYLEHVLVRKEAREREKRELLAPLLHLAKRYKEAHFSFCESENAGSAETSGGYFSTLFGRFHRKLERLCQLYSVMAFNASKYDYPLLLPSLSLAANRTAGVSMKVQKRGSAVTSMTLTGQRGRGVTFRDPLLLLDSSCSLAKLAKMCELEMEKAPLPYRQLDGLDCLDRPEFSWDQADWRDELNGRDIPLEEIELCRKLFRKLGCKNVGDYLREYLSIDCMLLKDCAVSLFHQFDKTLDVSPLDAGRYTIASYSYYSSQMYLFRNCRPATFMPRVPCIYNALRQATTGGLVEVSRGKVVCGDPGQAGAVNPHLGRLGSDVLLPPAPESLTLPPEVQAVMDEALSEEGRRKIPFFHGCRTGYVQGEEPPDPVLEDGGESTRLPDPDSLSVRHIVRSAIIAADNDVSAERTLEEARARQSPEVSRYISCHDVASEYATSCKFV